MLNLIYIHDAFQIYITMHQTIYCREPVTRFEIMLVFQLRFTHIVSEKLKQVKQSLCLAPDKESKLIFKMQMRKAAAVTIICFQLLKNALF